MLQYNAIIRIITPIIIQTGQQYDLWDLMPNPKNPKEIWIINPSLAYASLSQEMQKKFDLLIDELSKLKGDAVKQKMTALRDMLHGAVISNPSVIMQKAQGLDNFKEELTRNPNAEIRKIYKESLTNRPYIPGSSIKGMIRTAVLEAIRKNKQLIPNIDRDHDVRRGKVSIKAVHSFEDRILLGANRRKVYDDPFKFLHVSDFIIEKTDTIFGTVRVTSARGKIPTYTEMTGCELLNNQEYLAKGTITIYDDELKKYLATLNQYDKSALHILPQVFRAEFILGALKNFYEPLLNNKKHPVDSEIKNLMQNKNKSNTAVPIRLGRFSQVESKTFKVERTWERGDSRRMNFEGGKTRAYVKGTIGAGWGLMTLTKA
ncbi:MAG TPA: type III-A CRISPR-associated RAMP protein Csm5 [Spirochaetota bacterium]|nr:type III-A CRISPR-associated RAMP protein Csm5 [Spirochaetota bacterium]